MDECNADLGHPCDAGEDEGPCAKCKEWLTQEERYYRSLWNASTLLDRDPKKYIADMQDAGRARLLP